MLDFILFIIMGGIIGWLASLVMNRDASMGIVLNIVVGIAGSILGKFLFSFFSGDISTIWNEPLDIKGLVAAFVGSTILLAVINLIKRKKLR